MRIALYRGYPTIVTSILPREEEVLSAASVRTRSWQHKLYTLLDSLVAPILDMIRLLP